MLFRLRWFFFAVLLALVLAGLPFVPAALVPDHALDVWFVEDDPALEAYHRFHDRFGNDEVVLLAYHRPDGLVHPPELRKLEQLTERLEHIDGVHRVYSLTNARDVVRDRLILRVVRPVAEYIDRPAYLRRFLDASPLVRGRLLNEDGTTALLWIQMEVMADIDRERGRILDEIEAAAAAVLGPGEARLAGTGVLYEGLNEITQRDFGLFMGLSYLVMMLLLYLLFRRTAFVLLALGVMGTATLITLAAMGLAGVQVNMVTVILPTVITVLGLADLIHVLNQYAGRAPGAVGPAEATQQTLRAVFRPALFTSLTTAAGFLSLTATSVSALRELGLFAAVGIAAALAATFCLSAVVLPALDPGRRSPAAVVRTDRGLRALLGALTRHPRRFAVVCGVLALLAAAGLARLEADTYTLGYLPEDHRVVRDHRFITEHWGPYATVEMTVRPRGEAGDLRDPAVLRAMAAFSEEVADLEHIQGAFGLHTLLARYSDVRYGSDRVLHSARQIREAIQVMEAGGAEDLHALVSPDYKVGRITLTGEMLSAAALGAELDRVGALAEAHLGELAEVRFAGYPPLYVKIIDYVVEAQVFSFYLALGLIFLLITLFLRDLKLALIALVPNLFPVLLLLGLMGWLGIPLDVATATVAAIVLGVAVDDTIHLLVHVQKRHRGSTLPEPEVELATVGRSVVFTSLVLALGFSVLMLAGVKTVFYFGLLTTFAAAAALVGDLVLLPLLLRYFYRSEPAEPPVPSLPARSLHHSAG